MVGAELAPALLLSGNDELWGKMGCGCKGGCDGFSSPTCQDGVEYTGGFHSGLLAPFILEKRAFGVFDQVLRDPLPEVVGERDPIDLCLSVALEEGRGVLPGWTARSLFSGIDEVALSRGQLHVVPVDYKHTAILRA